MKRTTRQTIKEFFEPVKATPRNIFFIILCSIASGLFATYSVIFLQYATIAIEQKNPMQFKHWIIIWLGVIVSRFLIRVFYKIFVIKAIGWMQTLAYQKYMTKIFLSDNTQVEKLGTGRLVSLFQKGRIANIRLLWELLGDGAVIMITFIITFITIANKNIFFFFTSIIMFSISIIWIRILYKKSQKYRKLGKDIDTEMDRVTVKHIMSKFEILQNNKIEQEISIVYKKNEEWMVIRMREKIWQRASFDGSDFSINILRVSIAAFIGRGVIQGKYLISDFVLLTGLAALLSTQVSKVVDIAKNFTDGRVHIEKLRDVLDDLGTEKHLAEGKSFVHSHGDIELRDIDYSYDDNKVFDKFSVKIEGGKKTALVGPSGSGKTTLMKIIAGYITADSGDMVVDNQKFSEISMLSYFKHVGYLTQEPNVFDGTIMDNLAYGVKDGIINQQDIEKVIKLAKCEFINDYSHGLNTEIGERGVRLSGGQKQRLAIAKIMLKNPEIILLDEPTSAMDSFNEEEVTQALHNLFQGKTVIVIAHRLQTAKQADRIIYLDHGKIVEEGTHESLVAYESRYKKMLDLQSGF